MKLAHARKLLRQKLAHYIAIWQGEINGADRQIEWVLLWRAHAEIITTKELLRHSFVLTAARIERGVFGAV